MGKVKRASSAWIYFTNANRKAFQDKNPEAKMTDLTKLMGEAWGKLTPAEKKPYEVKAAADKERYTKEKAEASSSSSDEEKDDKKGKRKGKRGGKKDKDPNAPKKPATAWILYLNKHRAAFQKKHTDKKITEITTLVSKQWQAETDAGKAEFQKEADVLKAKYAKAKAAYEAKKKEESDSDSDSDSEPKKKKAKKGSGKKKADSDSE